MLSAVFTSLFCVISQCTNRNRDPRLDNAARFRTLASNVKLAGVGLWRDHNSVNMTTKSRVNIHFMHTLWAGARPRVAGRARPRRGKRVSEAEIWSPLFNLSSPTNGVSMFGTPLPGCTGVCTSIAPLLFVSGRSIVRSLTCHAENRQLVI